MADLVRPSAVAQMTSLSVRKVQEMAAAGKLPSAAKLGGVWTFDPAAIKAWIQERREVVRLRNCLPVATSRATRLGGIESAPDESIAEAYKRLIHGKPKSGLRHGVKGSNGRRAKSKAATHSKARS
jgi:predicted DNA-binding transcriptional regulator AlpA